MADKFTKSKRSQIMRAVKAKDTSPEMVVRRLVHGMGYRYRLHRKDLPGHPDLVFAGRGAVIFVHGCWWHAHPCKRGDREPKTNADYWNAKRERNRLRDQRVQRQLRKAGWRVMVIWECQLRDLSRIERRVRRFLEA